MLGKIKYYKGSKVPDMTPEIMAAFMLSTSGHYNGDSNCAALAALEHARDYAETDEKFGFWMNVYSAVTLWNLNLTNRKGN